MVINCNLFSSRFYVEEDTSWLGNINTLSDKYISEALENNRKKLNQYYAWYNTSIFPL